MANKDLLFLNIPFPNHHYSEQEYKQLFAFSKCSFSKTTFFIGIKIFNKDLNKKRWPQTTCLVTFESEVPPTSYISNCSICKWFAACSISTHRAIIVGTYSRVQGEFPPDCILLNRAGGPENSDHRGEPAFKKPV